MKETKKMFYCLWSFAGDATTSIQQQQQQKGTKRHGILLIIDRKKRRKKTSTKGCSKVTECYGRETRRTRLYNGTSCQQKQKMNSKHYDRVDVDPFLYTQREGIGAVKKEKNKGENQRDNVLVMLCRHRYCKRTEKIKEKTNATMSL